MTKRKASVALDASNEGNGTQDNTSNNASVVNVIHTSSNQQNGSSIAGDRQQQIDDSNNQNDNSNSSSTNNNSNNNSGGQHKSKKERADNWSSAEITVLHRGIDSRREIFYGPPSQATKKQRELAWNEITKEVNSVSTTPRSLSQVMKKFKNEKCRAKRKFIDSDKDGQSNASSNNNSSSATVTNNTNDTTNLSAQNHATNNQQQLQSQPQQSNHMTSDNNISAPQSSINVVKLAPQNVAKTMIDLPGGHVQQIQMPNEDMVLIVQPEMDGLLSGMNIVSDALQNHQHNHHGQHTIQTLNTGQSLANGTISNGMMARTIPATSMCSLVYSTGGEVCTQEQQVPPNVSAQGTLTTNHLGLNAQNLMHHRVSLEQNQAQHQQQQQQHHHQLHHSQQQQQPQTQSHQQPSQHPQHQSQQQQQQHHHHHQQQQQQQQQQGTLHQQHFTQNHLTPTGTMNNTGGVAVESQLKNLLINLLFKDGQHSSMPIVTQAQDFNKQRNDPLTTIATSLNKIEGHLSKISKMASTLLAQNMNINMVENSNIATQLSGTTNISGLNSSDVGNNNNNNVSISNTGNKNQRSTEA